MHLLLSVLVRSSEVDHDHVVLLLQLFELSGALEKCGLLAGSLVDPSSYFFCFKAAVVLDWGLVDKQ